MRSRSLFAILMAVAVAGACSDSPTPVAPQPIAVPVQFDSAAHNDVDVPHNYRTHLTGKEEVPERETMGQGQAIFQLSPDGSSLSYRLIVANIENVTQAHIHMAPFGANGGIVAWLYPSAPPAVLIPGRTQGVLGEGVITAANLVGALANQSLDALVAAMNAGNTYVNVHTTQFPPGEIRGQID